jgi:hypothetical protein
MLPTPLLEFLCPPFVDRVSTLPNTLGYEESVKKNISLRSKVWNSVNKRMNFLMLEVAHLPLLPNLPPTLPHPPPQNPLLPRYTKLFFRSSSDP